MDGGQGHRALRIRLLGNTRVHCGATGSTTGVVNWKTRDIIDLDYTARPLIVRDNKERDVQITQEARIASAPGAPARLGEGVRLRSQTGVFFFSQKYDQDAINYRGRRYR